MFGIRNIIVVSLKVKILSEGTIVTISCVVGPGCGYPLLWARLWVPIVVGQVVGTHCCGPGCGYPLLWARLWVPIVVGQVVGTHCCGPGCGYTLLWARLWVPIVVGQVGGNL